MANGLQTSWRRAWSPWTVSTAALTAMVMAPFVVLAGYLVFGVAAEWGHIARHLLPRYIGNTAMLTAGVALVTLLIGVPTAWLVAVYDFPARRTLAWALLLPLAIPTYLAAFTWAGILDWAGPVQSTLRRTFPGHDGTWLPFEIMSMPGAILVLASVLYPYVYLVTRVSFQRQSHLVLEAARTLGRPPLQCFLRVALPLARPAMAGGVALALMETLNDYGAVKYYGIDTFTTAIFRAWFGLNDMTSAIRLSACLLGAVALVMALEYGLRGRARFGNGGSDQGAQRLRLTGWRGWGASLVCALPVLVAFVVPVLMLSAWAASTWRQVLERDFLLLVRNSFLLAAGAALVAVVIAIVIAFTVHLYRRRSLRLIAGAASVGYAVPGAVIAIGVLVLCIAGDRLLGRWSAGHTGLLFTGSVAALLGAYVVRFLAVGKQTMSAGFEGLGNRLQAASRTLGAGPSRTLFQIELPLLRGSVAAAALLLFVEVLKELPLTLILRPFNFDTLATRAYQYASEEMLAQSAAPALLILLTGLLPIILINRLSQRQASPS